MSSIEDLIQEDIHASIRELDAGAMHNYGLSTHYDVLFESKRYPPVALVGIAYYLRYGSYPEKIKGGLNTPCFRVLENNGFHIVDKLTSKIKYWWVNQNKTYREEIEGGYMWSPKKAKGNRIQQAYENMKFANVGDIVFSYNRKSINHVGVVTRRAYSKYKPTEFDNSNNSWDNEGWMVDVDYTPCTQKISPKMHYDEIKDLLPNKYSPIKTNQADPNKNGDGFEIYLAAISIELGEKLIALTNSSRLIQDYAYATKLEDKIKNDSTISRTEKETLIKARLGQGKFRSDVINHHKKCIFTGISKPELLRASHVKPWVKCDNNEERLDKLNGLPLTPTYDHLFDKGYISFNENGECLISDKLNKNECLAIGLDLENLPSINYTSSAQAKYHQYHLKNIFNR